MPSSKQSDRSKEVEQVSGDPDKGHEKVIVDSFYFRLHNTLSAYDDFCLVAYA